MATVRNPLPSGIGAVLLLVGLTTSALGQVGGGGEAVMGGDTGDSLRLAGRLLCVGCTYEEARKAHPGEEPRVLYELTHGAARAVIKVEVVDNAERWEDLTLSRQIEVQGEERWWQELTAAATGQQRVELAGRIRNMRALELAEVVISDDAQRGGEPAGAVSKRLERSHAPQTVEPAGRGQLQQAPLRPQVPQ
jgi:hypothetical protein